MQEAKNLHLRKLFLLYKHSAKINAWMQTRKKSYGNKTLKRFLWMP